MKKNRQQKISFSKNAGHLSHFAGCGTSDEKCVTVPPNVGWFTHYVYKGVTVRSCLCCLFTGYKAINWGL